MRHVRSHFITFIVIAVLYVCSLVKHAIEKHKPIMLLNVGPTRADALAGIDAIEIEAGTIIRDVVKQVLWVLVSIDPFVKTS